MYRISNLELSFFKYNEQCLPPVQYEPWYIWTKEGYKIEMKFRKMRKKSLNNF